MTTGGESEALWILFRMHRPCRSIWHEKRWCVQQLKRCLSYSVGQAFHGIGVNPGGRGVINNPQICDLAEGLESLKGLVWISAQLFDIFDIKVQGAVEECSHCSLNHNASGNVLSSSSTLGLFRDWTLVIMTLCWQAAIVNPLHCSPSFLLTSSIACLCWTCRPVLHPTHFRWFPLMAKVSVVLVLQVLKSQY